MPLMSGAVPVQGTVGELLSFQSAPSSPTYNGRSNQIGWLVDFRMKKIDKLHSSLLCDMP